MKASCCNYTLFTLEVSFLITRFAMSSLPVELFPEIISTLATPAHPLQIGHEVSVLSTLRRLCLVNHFIRRLSIPCLYSSVVLYTENQLQLLLRTYNSSTALCSHTKSLAVHSFPDNIKVIHFLFYLLGPYLRRLTMFGITAADLGSSSLVRDALQQHCSNLEYFVLLENNMESSLRLAVFQPPYLFWPEFKMLRRLVLDDPLIDNAFAEHIAEMPCLTHLALIDPRWGRGSPPQLSQAGTSLQMIALVFREIGEWYAISLMKVGSLLKNPRDGLDVQFIKLGEDDMYSKGRIQEWVCDGTLWELKSNFVACGGLW